MPRHPGKGGALGVEIPEVGMSYNRAALLLWLKPQATRAIFGGQTRFRGNGCIICIVRLHEVKACGRIFLYRSILRPHRPITGELHSTRSSGLL